MTIRKFAVLFWAFLIASAAIAGEEQRTRIEIDVDSDAAGHQTFKFDSKDAGFNLQDMAVGETRVLTDESGSTAQVIRTEDGFELDINGEKIDISDLHAMNGPHSGHKMMMHVNADGHAADIDTDVVIDKDVRKVKIVRSGDTEDVTIISGSAIDEATRQRIREALESSGQSGEVVFIDSSEFDVDGETQAHGKREVRIIKKKVDVTN